MELESPEVDAVVPPGLELLEPEDPEELEFEGIEGVLELDEDEDAVGIDGVELRLELDDEDDEELLLLELEDEDAVGIEGEELELLLWLVSVLQPAKIRLKTEAATKVLIIGNADAEVFMSSLRSSPRSSLRFFLADPTFAIANTRTGS